MADEKPDDTEETPPTEPTEQETPPAAEPQGKVFSQEEVDALIKDRLARDRRSRPKPKPQPAPTEDLAAQLGTVIADQLKPLGETVASLQAKIDAQEAKESSRAFDQAFDALGKIPESARDMVKQLAEATKPEDLSKWLAETATKGGWAGNGKPTDEPVPPDTASPGATPTATKDFSGVIDPRSLTSEDVRHLRESGQLIATLERWRTQGQGSAAIFGKRTPVKE
jgi:hypothetical protein